MLDNLVIQPLDSFNPLPGDELPQASVVVLIKPGDDLRLVMAKKADHLRKHAGESVFPGGMLEDNESHLQAALRECEEELGISADAIDIVGCLSRYVTKHDVALYPFVGILNRPVQYQLDTTEMQAVFEVPVSYLSKSEHLLQERVVFRGQKKTVYYFQYQQFKIWGITALIIKELVGL